jgi:hypothetical protein
MKVSSVSSIRHPAFDRASRAFSGQERQRRDPVLAILGPTGSGKTKLLQDLLHHLATADREGGKWACILLDLDGVPFGSLDQMYGFIAPRLAQAAADAGVMAPAPKGTGSQQIESAIQAAAQAADGKLVLALDHLNCVPEFFALDFSQLLRGMKEHDEGFYGVGGMALIMSGSLSLFQLTIAEKSVFHLATQIGLPACSPAECRLYLAQALQEAGLAATNELIEFLYEETQAESGFLRAVLSRLGQEPNLDTLRQSISTPDPDEIPHLRHMGLHWYLKDSLRKVVSELLQNRRVHRRSVAPDIDDHQLTGVVRLEAETRTYALRNSIVRRFMAALRDGVKPPFLVEIEEARNAIRLAPDLGACLPGLERAWEALVGYPDPGFQIVFADSAGRRRENLELSRRLNVPKSVDTAWMSAHRDGGTAFTVDEANISFALPLGRNQAFCWLVSTVRRSAEPFTDFVFQHWRGFASLIADTLVARAFEAILARGASPTPAWSAINETRGMARLIVHDDGAILINNGRTLAFRGHPDKKWTAFANRGDFIRESMSNVELDSAIEEVGEKVRVALEPIDGITAHSLEDPTSHHWIICSSIEGLKSPIELLPVRRTPLCLHTGVARQIMEYPPPPNLRRPFGELLAALRESGPLRALLVGVDPDERLAVEVEIEGVKSRIMEGCSRMGLASPVIDIVPSAQASAARLRDMLKNKYHFFHFCGHGLPSKIRLNKAGMAEDVPSSLLKEWLRDAGVILCFLSACYSGRSEGDGLLSSSGTIEDLLAAGIPNIVGFRWAVTSKSSAVLASNFYETLLSPGETPFTAIWKARRASRGADSLSDAWASSLLITQCPG